MDGATNIKRNCICAYFTSERSINVSLLTILSESVHKSTREGVFMLLLDKNDTPR